MTREEVEERLEEYAAYTAIKEAHEDAEENPSETGDDNLENGENNNSQDSIEEATSVEGDVPQDEAGPQDGKRTPLSHLLIIVIFQNSTCQTLVLWVSACKTQTLQKQFSIELIYLMSL